MASQQTSTGSASKSVVYNAAAIAKRLYKGTFLSSADVCEAWKEYFSDLKTNEDVEEPIDDKLSEMETADSKTIDREQKKTGKTITYQPELDEVVKSILWQTNFSIFKTIGATRSL